MLAQIGCLALRWSRPLDGTPQPVPIRRAADGWYATCSGDQVPLQPLPVTGQATGLDLGIACFATLAAKGKPVDTPRVFGGWQMQLKRAQRRVGRRHKGSKGSKGSKRRRKAVKLLAKAQQTGRRARADFPHQTARPLVPAYDVIDHESLQVANLLQNHQLAKASADVGWRTFLRPLACKAADAGKPVVAVSPAVTAQACSGCCGVGHEGLVGSLASLPGRWDAPASGP